MDTVLLCHAFDKLFLCVCYTGLYLTNPLEIVSERSAMKQLCSDSVLMVRRQDIISRFRKTTDLGELLGHPDPRWSTMNVLGQLICSDHGDWVVSCKVHVQSCYHL